MSNQPTTTHGAIALYLLKYDCFMGTCELQVRRAVPIKLKYKLSLRKYDNEIRQRMTKSKLA